MCVGCMLLSCGDMRLARAWVQAFVAWEGCFVGRLFFGGVNEGGSGLGEEGNIIDMCGM